MNNKSPKHKVGTVRSHKFINTKTEKAYNDITRLAAFISNCPISVVTFLDDHYEYFKSRHNCEIEKTPIEHSFCPYAIDSGREFFELEDTRRDKRFKSNPLVKSPNNFVFYFGIPLKTPSGQAIGALSVIDHKPRKLDAEQKDHLQLLANQVMQLFELDKFNGEQKENNLQTSQESEKRFKYLVQEGSDLIAILNEEGNFKYTSPSMSIFLGQDADSLIDKNAFDFIHPDDLERILKDFERLKSSKQLTTDPFRLYHQEDGWRWIQTNGTNLMGENAVDGFVVTSTDVTEIIEAKKKLETSEARYRSLNESQTNYVVRIDLEGNYSYVNRKFERDFSWIYGNNGIIGNKSLETVCDYHHQRIMDIAQKCFAQPGKVLKAEIDKLAPSGKVLNTLWDFTALRDESGKIAEIQCVGIDISDRIKFEKALKKSKERFELISKVSSECFFDYHPKTDHFYVSEGFNNIFGFDLDQYSRDINLLKSLIHPKDKEWVFEAFEKALFHPQKNKFVIECRMCQLNGEYIFVEIKSLFIRDKNGFPKRMLGVINDITTKYFYNQLDIIEKEIMQLAIEPEATLSSVLDQFMIKLEGLFPGMRATVLRVENGLLQKCSAPSMPEEYTNLIHGLSIGQNRGSCGTAAFIGEEVIAENIFNDERWEGFHDLGLKYNFSACWSVPIFDESGKVVATFANYYKHPRQPGELERKTFNRAQRLISIIMVKIAYVNSIRENNERYQLINKATNDAVYDWDVFNDRFFWGDGMRRTFGHKVNNSSYSLNDWESKVHPKDIKGAIDSLNQFFKDKNKEKWTYNYRFARANGTYAWVEEIGYLVRDCEGEPERMIGVLRDETAAKEAKIQQAVQQKVASCFKEELDLNSILDLVLEYLSDIGHFEFAEIWTSGIESRFLHRLVKYSKGKQGDLFYQEKNNQLDRIEKGEGLPGVVWTQKKEVIWNDIKHRKDFSRKIAAKNAGIKAAAGVPLFHNENMIGVLLFGLTEINNLGKETLDPFLSLKEFLGAEILRKQQEEEMQLLFESAPEILAIASSDGLFTKVNPAFCKLTGYTEEELTSQSYENFVHPDDLNSSQEEFVESISGARTAQNFINRWRTKSGDYIYISWFSSPVFDKEGKVFCFGRDVTQMFYLQELLDHATSLSRVGAWEMDLIKDQVYFSKVTKQILQVGEDFKPNWENALNFYQEGTREEVQEAAEKGIKDGISWDKEWLLVTAKGEERWVRSIGKPVFSNGKVVKLHGSFQDIHDRKLIENRLKSISDNIPGVLFQYELQSDGKDRVTSISAGSKSILGLNPEECMEDIDKVWTGIQAGGSLDQFKGSILASMENLSNFHEKYRYIMPDGSVRYHETIGKPHRKPDGSTIWDCVVLDITEKNELEELAERTSNLARIGSWELDLLKPANENLFWSSMTREILEVDESYHPTSTECLNFYDPKTQARVKKVMQELEIQGNPFDEELLITTAAGNKRWVRCIGEGEWVGGKCVKIFGSYQDIHDKKIAELELANAFEEKDRILESIGDAFFSADNDWIVHYWNKAAEDLTGISREDILGCNLWEKFPLAKKMKFYTEIEKALQEQTSAHFEEYNLHAQMWLDVNAYSSLEGISVFFRDITEKKEAEKKLKESNDRFEKMAEATNDAIWDYNPIEDKLFWGKGFLTQFGYDPKITKPNLEFLISLIHPEERPTIVKKLELVFQDPNFSNWYEEYRFKKSDGSYALIIDRAKFIRNKMGKVIRVVGAMTNISHRKAYEDSLKKLNKELEERARELAISNEELEQFAYIASHDLQEPLRMVSSFLSQLNKKYGDSLDDKAHQYIHFAVDGAHRMRHIILELLEYSRVGKHPEALEKVDLNRVVEETKRLLHREINKSGAKIFSKNLPVILSYTTPLLQVFQNLISNAIKYTADGVSPEIHILVKKKQNSWLIEVKDNGIGIEPEYFDKIFVIFQRLHSRNEYSGTGMGLALVKKNIETLGGKVGVKSEKGEGSTFFFTIPFHEGKIE